jgi:signal transduction histidine kinase
MAGTLDADAKLKLLEAALARLPVGISLVEAPSGRVLFRNEAAARITGRDASRLPRGVADWGTFAGYRPDGTRYAPEEWPLARSILAGETVTGEDVEMEREDGTRAVVRMASAPVRGDDGAIIAGLLTFDDLTAEKRAERAREQALADTSVLYRLTDAANRARSPEPILEAALDAIRDGLGAERAAVLLFDDAGVMRFRAWRGLSDAYRRAVEGHTPWTPTSPDPQPIVVPDVRDDAGLAAYAPVFAQEKIRALAFIPLVYGERVLGKFMLYAEAPRALDARQLDQALAIAGPVASAVGRAQAEASLREASRRKDEFLAMLSHELRNPLAAARNAVHLLASISPDDAGRRRWMDVVDRQTGNLVRIVDDLLDVSRISRGRFELRRAPLDLRETVERAVAATAAPLAAHTLTVELGDAPLVVDGDPVRLEQVLVNLLVNAAKFTPPGGEVSVAAARAGGEVTVTVGDTGSGIEAERLERVFEIFDQGSRDLARTQGGLGIGLAIVRGLVERHGGRVTAASPGPGKGSTFVVTLPESPAAEVDALRAGLATLSLSEDPAAVPGLEPASLPSASGRRGPGGR